MFKIFSPRLRVPAIKMSFVFDLFEKRVKSCVLRKSMPHPFHFRTSPPEDLVISMPHFFSGNPSNKKPGGAASYRNGL
jgi:hypothetical protein